MTDKEERIFVFTTTKYTIKETNKDGVIVDGFIEPRDKAKMYTRQEAIEKIKNASEFYLSHKLGCTKEEEAECILNALLRSEK